MMIACLLLLDMAVFNIDCMVLEVEGHRIPQRLRPFALVRR